MPLKVDSLITNQLTVAGESVGPKYKVYTALLTQTGTTAPVATVLENTLDLNPTYYYDSTGAYRLEDLSGLLTTNKTFVLATGNGGGGVSVTINDTTTIEINSINMYSGDAQDDIFLNTPIEIRVYN